MISHSQDIECLLTKVHPYAPEVVQDFQDSGKVSNALGCYGVVAYHCWNYIAPQHIDNDATWSVSYQLRKRGCSGTEFSFAYTEWGCYLETVENCIWYEFIYYSDCEIESLLFVRWFQGKDMHGTILPKKSTVKSGNGLSQGVVVTLPRKGLKAAESFEQGRASWKALCDYWKIDI